MQFRIAHIVFDVAGTLIKPVESVESTYVEKGQRHGSNLSEQEIRSRFRPAFQEAFRSDSVSRSSHELQREQWKKLVQSVFTDLLDCNSLFEELWGYYAEPSAWQIYPDVREAWAFLKSRPVTISLASNFDDRLFRIVEGCPPLDSADFVFSSSQVGFAKPNIQFFRSIESTLGASGKEILMIGDDLINDVEGPIQAGWRARLIDRKSQQKKASAFATLTQIKELFST